MVNGMSAEPGLSMPNRKGQPVLVNEGLQGLGTHHIVVLEDRVQANDRKLVFGKHCAHLAGLRQAVQHASGAQHLEGVQHHHAPVQRVQTQATGRIDPLGNIERWRGLKGPMWNSRFRRQILHPARKSGLCQWHPPVRRRRWFSLGPCAAAWWTAAKWFARDMFLMRRPTASASASAARPQFPIYQDSA